MKRSHPLSAAQTALLCGAGGLIMSLSFLIPALIYTRFQHLGLLSRAILIAPPFLFGITLLFLSTRRLKRGIKQGRWPSTEIEALRSTLDSRFWRATTISCVIVWGVSFFFHGRLHAFGWAAYPLYLALNALQTQLKYPNDHPNAILTISAAHPAPLTSNHWGQ
jgi:hypothetical protein